ncbi:MAG: LysM peptidoglycan-binding domain-containing protein, partial [Rhodanobacter sp.]
ASSSDSGVGKAVATGTPARDVHKVGRGESLSSIARQYGVSVGALKNANQISSNTVRAGTTLTIPAG